MIPHITRELLPGVISTYGCWNGYGWIQVTEPLWRRLDVGGRRDRIGDTCVRNRPRDPDWVRDLNSEGEVRGVAAQVDSGQDQVLDLDQDAGLAADHDRDRV